MVIWLQVAETGQFGPKVNVLIHMGIHTQSKQHWRTRPRSGHTKIALPSGDPGSRMESTASPNDMQFVLMLMFLLFLFLAVWGFLSLHYSAQIWIPKRMTPSGISQAICLPNDSKSRMCILGEGEIEASKQVQGVVNSGRAKGCWATEITTTTLRFPSWWSESPFGEALKVQASLIHTYLLEVMIWRQGPHSVCLLCPFPLPIIPCSATGNY